MCSSPLCHDSTVGTRTSMNLFDPKFRNKRELSSRFKGCSSSLMAGSTFDCIGCMVTVKITASFISRSCRRPSSQARRSDLGGSLWPLKARDFFNAAQKTSWSFQASLYSKSRRVTSTSHSSATRITSHMTTKGAFPRPLGVVASLVSVPRIL